MKSRLSLIFATLVILLGTMIWVVQERPNVVAIPAMSAEPAPSARVQPAAKPSPMPPPVAPTVALTVAPPIAPAVAAAPVAVPAPITAAAPVATNPIPILQSKSSPTVHVASSGDVTYVARTGDTVSQLAIALLGSDSKEHRDAVIAANPSLKENPDLVLAEQTYSIPPSQQDVSNAKSASSQTAPNQAAPNQAATDQAAAKASVPKLRYMAQPGDSVSVLAGNLLGGNSATNRDAIIAGNASLQQDPDHVVAGQSYTIAAPNGLAADPNAPQAKPPTTRPDADDIVRQSASRNLRYTAKPGDSVSGLATVLLGSDTPANRDLIIKNNPSLKQDPDHLIAGQTYWIAAPVAASMP